MGDLILCKTRMAGTPYFIESFGLNVYSLEEISYLSLRHSDMITTSLMSSELTSWVGSELGLKDLERELNDLIAEGTTLHVFMGRLLSGSGYLNDKEMEQAINNISEMENKSLTEIRKLKADRFFAMGKYSDAILEYSSMLSAKKDLKLTTSLEADILICLGSSYSRLFYFKEGRECFLRAYEKTRQNDALEKALYADLCAGDTLDFNKIRDKYLVPPDIIEAVEQYFGIVKSGRKAVEFSENISKTDDPSSVSRLIEIWKDDYIKKNGN
jgi:tetratricopeptide (TPR) repeat protein